MLLIPDNVLEIITQKIKELDSLSTDPITLEKPKTTLFIHYKDNPSLVFLFDKQSLIDIKDTADNIRNTIAKIDADDTGIAIFLTANRNLPPSLDLDSIEDNRLTPEEIKAAKEKQAALELYEKTLNKLLCGILSKNHDDAVIAVAISELGENLVSLRDKFKNNMNVDDLHKAAQSIYHTILGNEEDNLSDAECHALVSSAPYRSKMGNLNERVQRDTSYPNELMRYCAELQLQQILLKNTLEKEIANLSLTTVHCPYKRGQIDVPASLATEEAAAYFLSILTDLEKLNESNMIEENSALHWYLCNDTTPVALTSAQRARLDAAGCSELRVSLVHGPQNLILTWSSKLRHTS